MAQSKQSDRVRRAPRVKLAGTILALIQLENGRQIRARLHQLSFTGGLLHMEKPLDEGIKVEVMFHVAGSTVRSKAAMTRVCSHFLARDRFHRGRHVHQMSQYRQM